MGMTNLQRLRRVEIPLAVPIIMAGIRTAVLINIGVTAIAAYIGAGGLGFSSRAGSSRPTLDSSSQAPWPSASWPSWRTTGC